MPGNPNELQAVIMKSTYYADQNFFHFFRSIQMEKWADKNSMIMESRFESWKLHSYSNFHPYIVTRENMNFLFPIIEDVLYMYFSNKHVKMHIYK